jgi:SOS-response transcriptional repressor LexA
VALSIVGGDDKSVVGGARASYALVMADLPGRGQETIGVLLEDAEADALYVKFRRDWDEIADREDAEVLEALAGDLTAKAGERGAEALLGFLEDSASNAVRVSDREAVPVDDFRRTLNRLYGRHVQPTVLQFRTHLPLYTLRVAAGKFLENEEVREEDWLETPEDLRLSADLFVARIEGHSMEPLIPDGSLCVFRAGVTGSRNGRLVLVEDLDTTGANRYAVKRYSSEKASAEDGEWRHTRIHLESLNPGYPSWDLEEDQERFRVIAEFERVLE